VAQTGVAQVEVEAEPRCCPLVWTLGWAGNPILLLTLVLMLLWLVRWVGRAVVVHRPVLWRSTTEQSYLNLPLLG
jgi:hypothetical protein